MNYTAPERVLCNSVDVSIADKHITVEVPKIIFTSLALIS